MWWNLGPHLERRMKAESGLGSATGLSMRASLTRSGTTFFKSATDTDEFFQVLKCKYGTLARAWRIGLDADQNGLLDFHEFCEAMKHIGYQGNLRTLWYNLDDDNSGSVSLKELDPAAAAAFEKFRVMATKKNNTIHEAWTTVIDADHSGTVSRGEFLEAALKFGYEDRREVHDLFSLLLLKPGASWITFDDIIFLQYWDDAKRAAAYRKRLPTKWINRDPYRFCSAGPIDEMNFEHDYEKVVSVDDEHMKSDFKDFLIDRFGSLPKAFAHMDGNDSGSLSMTEFQTEVCNNLQYCRYGDARRLFLGFNKDPGGSVTWNELGINTREWVQFQIERRRLQKRKDVELEQNRKAPLGASPRQRRGLERHVDRHRDKTPRADIMFGMPLPRGWGVPPSFHPTPEQLPRLSHCSTPR